MRQMLAGRTRVVLLSGVCGRAICTSGLRRGVEVTLGRKLALRAAEGAVRLYHIPAPCKRRQGAPQPPSVSSPASSALGMCACVCSIRKAGMRRGEARR